MSGANKIKQKSSVEAFAPASVANFAVGFDVLGFALEKMGDRVRVSKIEEKTVKVKSIEIDKSLDKNSFKELPKEAERNTAAMGLIELLNTHKLSFGFELEIFKGIPLGSGLGGSAASAAAAIFAANELLDKKLSKNELIKFAISGEAVASGARHGDNVIPSLLGGFLIVASEENSYSPVVFGDDWRVVILHPGFRLDTRQAREALPKNISLKTHTRAQTRLAMVLAALAENDSEKIKKFMVDEIIEPARAPLIPHFYDIKNAALDAGAAACSISGAGPALFALSQKSQAENVEAAMIAAARSTYPDLTHFISRISRNGARIIS